MYSTQTRRTLKKAVLVCSGSSVVGSGVYELLDLSNRRVYWVQPVRRPSSSRSHKALRLILAIFSLFSAFPHFTMLSPSRPLQYEKRETHRGRKTRRNKTRRPRRLRLTRGEKWRIGQKENTAGGGGVCNPLWCTGVGNRISVLMNKK